MEPESEFFDNEIIQKPMPKGKHGELKSKFTAFINSILGSKHIARAFPELRCTYSKISIVPDISVFRWDRIVSDRDGKIAKILFVLEHSTGMF
jgi:Uma2 family endonuclease